MSEAVQTTTAQDNTKAAAASNINPGGAQAQQTTVLASTDGVKTTDQTKAADAQSNVVPEKYDLKAPDGSLLSAAQLEALSSYAKEKKLTNEQAQELLNRENQAVAAYVQNQQQELAKKPEAWLAETKADKEIGGEEFGKNVELAKRVLSRFGSDDFKKVLNETGLGNHKELVRLFVRIGKSMSEDTLILPGAQAGGQKRIEDIFYPGASNE